MTLIDKYKEILNKCDCKEPSVPVIFNSGTGPRLIGYAKDQSDVDCCLIFNRLSATYISKAQIDGETRSFFVAHG